jgi:hypothetical protein
MKKIVVLLVVISLAVVGYALADKSKLDLKVGDTVYACNCGDACPCKTMSKNEGDCTCNNKMVKATVTKVEGDKVMLKADGWDKERAFPTQGKYACACGEGCKCDTISQNPGKCACGKDMKKVM